MTRCGQKQPEDGDKLDFADRLFTGPINSIYSAFVEQHWITVSRFRECEECKNPPLFAFGSVQAPIFSCNPHCMLSSIMISTINYRP